MKCYEVERLAHVFYDEELDELRRLDFKKHLAKCPSCSRGFRMVKEQLDTLRNSLKLADPGEDFTSRVLTAVQRGNNVLDLPKVYNWHPGLGMLIPLKTSYLATADDCRTIGGNNPWSDYREWREVWRRISSVSHNFYLARTSQG